MQPIVLINAVGLTPRLLEHAPRLKAIAAAGLGQRTCPRYCPPSPAPPRRPADRRAAEQARRRRQRLALPRHQRGALLAAVQSADSGRAALRDRPRPRRANAASRSRVPSCSGGSTRARRSISRVTPKPHYAVDGNKVFGITGTPASASGGAGDANSGRSRSRRSGGRWPGAEHAVDRRRGGLRRSATTNPTSRSSTCRTSITTRSGSGRRAPTCRSA